MAAIEIPFVDSHTAGEPTRVVWEGVNLGAGSLAERLARMRETQDWFRSAVVNEPRGSEVLVGALLCEPHDQSCALGVIFFNNVGYLGMCGHGTMGLITTLAWQGRLKPGTHRLETPVGIITVVLHEEGEVSVQNVPSYRQATAVRLSLPGMGTITGDVAWGGNWFFLAQDDQERLDLTNVERLTIITSQIREALNAAGYPEVDHVELFGPPLDPSANSRSFVLCPGKAYDRSPCGTGTSAKLACLAAEGKLAPGATWIQESILGTQFRGSYVWEDESRGIIRPTITGRAHVTATGRLILSADDPFRQGIRPGSMERNS